MISDRIIRGLESPEEPDSGFRNHACGFSAGAEFTACGFAVEEFVENGPEPKVTTNRITCPNCIEALNHVRKNFFYTKGKWFSYED